MTTLEIWFGYAMFAGAAAMAVAMVRDARRGWVTDEDGKVFRREDGRWNFRTHQAFQLAGLVILVLSGLGVLGYLGW
jgi:hypothetical protein